MNKNQLRFLLPSFFGVLIFLTPIPWNGHHTIGIGIVTGWIRGLMGDHGLSIVVMLTVITYLLTVPGTTLRTGWIHRRAWLKNLFDIPLIWLLLRLAGMAFGLVYLFQVGPELLKSESIGGAVFVGIAVNVLAIYISACLLLPLLTDFGFMEFVGTLARPVFHRVFRLPGRAAIDAVASFVGASSVGLLITIGQYDRGNYTAREASIIATNFSVVSIPFSLVVITVAGIEQYFFPWYGFVVLACLIAAIVTPRLPPLSRKADTFAAGGVSARSARVLQNRIDEPDVLRVFGHNRDHGPGDDRRPAHFSHADLQLAELSIHRAARSRAIAECRRGSARAVLGIPGSVHACHRRSQDRQQRNQLCPRGSVRLPTHLHVGSRRNHSTVELADQYHGPGPDLPAAHRDRTAGTHCRGTYRRQLEAAMAWPACSSLANGRLVGYTHAAGLNDVRP